MKTFRFLWWIVFLLALYGAYASFGLPHLRWSYSWRDDGQGYDPLAKRYYTRCSYLGLNSRFTIRHPPQGRCAWIIFNKHSAQE